MIDKLITALAEEILNPIIYLLFAIALLVFLWGIVGLIRGASDPKTLEKAKSYFMYGLFGMFIMISAYGIIRFITSTFNIPTEDNLDTIQPGMGGGNGGGGNGGGNGGGGTRNLDNL